LDRAAWAVVALGVVLRLAWATVGARTPRILADPAIYNQMARRIADGMGYVSFNRFPTSYYPPGYPFFLGGVQWVLERVGLGDRTPVGAAVAQSLLAGVMVAAVVVAGRRLGDRRVGLVAGLVVAVWPNLVLHASLMLSETLFLTCFSVFLAAVVTMVDDEGRLLRGRAAVAGLALGAATLVRPQVALVIPALAVAWLAARLGWRDVARRGGVLVAGVLVCVLPWTVRNAVVLDGFVPVSTNTGDNLCLGFNPTERARFGVPEYCDTGEFYIDGPESELRRDAETRRRALEWIRERPEALPWLSLRKLWWTYRIDTDALYASQSFGRDRWLGGAERPLELLSNGFYLVVMAAAVGGGVLVARRGWAVRRSDPVPLMVLAAAVSGALVPVLFFGDPRFKVPTAPCFALLAATAVVAVADRVRRRGTAAVEDADPAARAGSRSPR
jgi:4-amino-4-deoxy-L-arabinose transferase-like glycosyltransferase